MNIYRCTGSTRRKKTTPRQDSSFTLTHWRKQFLLATVVATHLNVSYQMIKTRIRTNDSFMCDFWFVPLLIPNATSQTHDVVAVFQLHRSTEN